MAIFEPVELEGTTVSRASVHNISIMEELELGVGDEIEVYKANMIIPQIARNLTRSGVRDIPAVCPVCGGKTQIRQEGNAKTLYLSLIHIYSLSGNGILQPLPVFPLLKRTTEINHCVT